MLFNPFESTNAPTHQRTHKYTRTHASKLSELSNKKGDYWNIWKIIEIEPEWSKSVESSEIYAVQQ